MDFTIDKDIQCLKDNIFLFTNTSQNSGLPMGYQWNFGDATTSVQDNPIKNYNAAGIYNVKLIATVGIGCKDSVSKMVNVMAPPVTPAISGKDLTRAAIDTYSVVNNPGSTYDWVINGGNQIAGGTGNEMVVQWTKDAGAATVKVTETSSNGCVGNLEVKRVTLLWPAAIDESGRSNLSLFPNPANNAVVLTGSNIPQGYYTLTLINQLGQVVYSQDWQQQENSMSRSLNLAELAPGIYMVVVQSDKLRLLERIVIER
ncbi:MAG: PKD domain-containing protein [Bacteroidia bacterium]